MFSLTCHETKEYVRAPIRLLKVPEKILLPQRTSSTRLRVQGLGTLDSSGSSSRVPTLGSYEQSTCQSGNRLRHKRFVEQGHICRDFPLRESKSCKTPITRRSQSRRQYLGCKKEKLGALKGKKYYTRLTLDTRSWNVLYGVVSLPKTNRIRTILVTKTFSLRPLQELCWIKGVRVTLCPPKTSIYKLYVYQVSRQVCVKLLGR